MTRLPATALVDVHDAGLTRVLEAALDAHARGEQAALAVVLETEGSTYARAGTAVLFSADRQVGWLSGGCLEPEIERVALQCALSGRIDWMEIDTRDDASLFSGNAVGCRGCQRIVLLPLSVMTDAVDVVTAWLQGDGPLGLQIDVAGGLQLSCAGHSMEQRLSCAPVPFEGGQALWALRWLPPPRALLLGAGPEVEPLLATLAGLGWQVRVCDPRAAWRDRCAAPVEASGAAEALLVTGARPDVVLLMHHNFELDLQALLALADSPVGFIGLLGPARRREDLLCLLPEACRASLLPRLHSPVGLALGGRGPAAIALCVAAELQAWRHASLPLRP